jgi:uncharacterized protein (DUF488 family)
MIYKGNLVMSRQKFVTCNWRKMNAYLMTDIGFSGLITTENKFLLSVYNTEEISCFLQNQINLSWKSH